MTVDEERAQTESYQIVHFHSGSYKQEAKFGFETKLPNK